MKEYQENDHVRNDTNVIKSDDLAYYEGLKRGYDGDDKKVWKMIHVKIKELTRNDDK